MKKSTNVDAAKAKLDDAAVATEAQAKGAMQHRQKTGNLVNILIKKENKQWQDKLH